jgi:hypothetical protein
MGNTVTFDPNTGVNPVFSGRGSFIQTPDILPVFWGPYWPGVGGMTVDTIMQALNGLVRGPFLSSLTQYGYGGSASVRPPRVDRGSNGITLPAQGLNVDQTNAISDAVLGYIRGLVSDDVIDNVDDNHELIVLVFLDNSVPVPSITDAVGNVQPILGANGAIDDPNFLDDATRFEILWVTTSSNQLATVTQTMSHELAEAISDPFGNGWHQTPPAAGNFGQIGDVCNQSGVVDGVAVSAYWSVETAACVIPTSELRNVSLSWQQPTHEAHDEPHRQGFVDLGPLCGGGRLFDYFERTYRNELTVSARIDGFEQPVIQWTLDGRPVSILGGSINVATNWVAEPPPSAGAAAPVKPATGAVSTFWTGTSSPQFGISVGPNAGNMSFRVTATVVEKFDAAGTQGRGLATRRTAVLDLDLHNQEINFGAGFNDAHQNCERVKHLFDGNGVVIGLPQPGDPGGLISRVVQVLRDQTLDRPVGLRNLALAVKDVRPELASTLVSLAEGTEARLLQRAAANQNNSIKDATQTADIGSRVAATIRFNGE